MSKLDPAFKSKWCEALRSGEYKQGKQWLRPTDDSFCCLGVAADLVHGRDAWFYDVYHVWTMDGADVHAPQSLYEAGLTAENANHLARMNDDGASFSEIADYIEKNL